MVDKNYYTQDNSYLMDLNVNYEIVSKNKNKTWILQI